MLNISLETIKYLFGSNRDTRMLSHGSLNLTVWLQGMKECHGRKSVE